MPEITITITDDEKKALEWDMLSILEWLENAIHNKARQCIDSIVEIETKRIQADPTRKLMSTDKTTIFRQAKVESAAERQARLEEELRQGA